MKPFQNLPCPTLNNFDIGMMNLSNVLAQRARSHHFGNEHILVFLRVEPIFLEINKARVTHFLEDFYLLDQRTDFRLGRLVVAISIKVRHDEGSNAPGKCSRPPHSLHPGQQPSKLF